MRFIKSLEQYLAQSSTTFFFFFWQLFLLIHSLVKIFVVLSQLPNPHTSTRSRNPNYKVLALNTVLFSPWMNGISDKRNSFKEPRKYFDGTNHETSSTRTNLEKDDASAEKLNESQESNSRKTSLSSMWRFLPKENKIMVQK